MKTKNADLVYKILFIVVGVILSGLMIAWLVSTYKDKKNEADAGNQKINSITGQMADFELTIYDGASIKGEALRELIAALTEKETQISIKVKTLDGFVGSYIYNTIPAENGRRINLDTSDTIAASPTSDKAALGYITPSGNFIGEVLRNDNDEIVCLQFTQYK